MGKGNKKKKEEKKTSKYLLPNVDVTKMPGAMTDMHWNSFQEDLHKDATFHLAKNAICNVPVAKVAVKREEFVKIHQTYSVHLPENKISNQKSSGRCWIFALLNCLRYDAIKNMNLPNDFELSQTYLHFWDKVERANYFLEGMLDNLDEPLDSRLMGWFFTGFWSDGGQWQMLLNLIDKYGLVPKHIMPETASSINTGAMNQAFTQKLQDFTCQFRKMHAAGASIDQLRAEKEKMMKVIYRIAAVHLGEPPSEFALQWRDKDKKFHREDSMTPREFYNNFVGVNLHDYVCLIHCPQKTKPFYKTYTVKYLGNVVGGNPVKYLNVEMDVFKEATVKQLKDDMPVWFGCDVGKYLDRTSGINDATMWDYESVYGTNYTMDKAERLDYGQSLMTHAMALTGVDLDKNKNPVQWRIENSWGDTSGDKGFYSMTDSWFDEFMYGVAIHKKYIDKKYLDMLEIEPVVLDPWDPMGSLA